MRIAGKQSTCKLSRSTSHVSVVAGLLIALSKKSFYHGNHIFFQQAKAHSSMVLFGRAPSQCLKQEQMTQLQQNCRA